MRENSVPIYGEKGAAVAGSSEQAAVGRESQGIDHIFAGRPKLFRRSVGTDAVNAAGIERRERNERRLRLNLPGTHNCAGSKSCGCLGRRNDGGGSLASALLFANRGNVDGTIAGDYQRRDFAFGSLVENESSGFRGIRILGALRGIPGNAQNASAGFGASDEISVGIESENANVSFVAGIEDFALAVGRDSEDLSLVAGGNVKSAVRRKREIPDVFCLGVEENGFFAVRRDFVNLAVGRSANIQRAFRIEGNGLRGKIGGIEYDAR